MISSLVYKPVMKGIRRIRRVIEPCVKMSRLTKDLRCADICPGDVVMVHSSLSMIGNVAGGARAVIDSLITAISDGGTLLMPCYGSAERVYKMADMGNRTDLRKTQSTVGSISEEFRKWPGVYRSSHPFSSVCAWGSMAKYVTSGHEENERICHRRSPVGRLIELHGKILGIGIGIAYPSVYHAVENKEDGFPFETYLPPRKISYINATGEEVDRMISRLDPKIARTRIDQDVNGAWIRERLTHYFTTKGIMRTYPLGKTQCWIMDATCLFTELKYLASQGVTIYLTQDEWEHSLKGKLEKAGVYLW